MTIKFFIKKFKQDILPSGGSFPYTIFYVDPNEPHIGRWFCNAVDYKRALLIFKQAIQLRDVNAHTVRGLRERWESFQKVADVKPRSTIALTNPSL